MAHSFDDEKNKCSTVKEWGMTRCLVHAPVGHTISNVAGGTTKTADRTCWRQWGKCHLLEISCLPRRIPRPRIGSEFSMGVQSPSTAGAGSRGPYGMFTALSMDHTTHALQLCFTLTVMGVYMTGILNSFLFSGLLTRSGHKEHSPRLLP